MKDVYSHLADVMLRLKSSQRALIVLYVAVLTLGWMQIALFYPVLFEKNIMVTIGALLGYTTCLYLGALLGVGVTLIFLDEVLDNKENTPSSSYDGSSVWASITGPLGYLACFSFIGIEHKLTGYTFVQCQVFIGGAALLLFIVAMGLGYKNAMRRRRKRALSSNEISVTNSSQDSQD